ncbi:CBO0543 family protein [Neobacillus sp. Marseille-QA0830]
MLILILTVIVFNSIVIFIPKRLSGIEFLTTTIFAMLLQMMVDVFLDLKYDLYGYFGKGVDWETLIYIFGIYPAINIVFLNFYPYEKKLIFKFGYILAWGVLAMVYETIFQWTDTFYLNGWKRGYSVILYPILYIMLMFFHKVTLHYLSRYKED